MEHKALLPVPHTVAALCIAAALSSTLAACDSNDDNAGPHTTTVVTSTITSRTAASSHTATPSSPSPSHPSPHATTTNPTHNAADPQRQGNTTGAPAGADTSTRGIIPAWAIGDWIGHTRGLSISRDGTGTFHSSNGASEVEYDVNLKINSVTGSAAAGKINTTVESINQPGDGAGATYQPGTRITFTIQDGVAKEDKDGPHFSWYCRYDLPEYKTAYGDNQNTCGG
ncbi:hypothetical protein ACGE24_08395 [Corynebacterium kroppenstedtii]|uniref:hypothetical protein n=1 Tax=Corynebacterium sp. PCR 32 TaxID=3351342 RepID=UPI0030AB492B